jgi:hypothetical protein
MARHSNIINLIENIVYILYMPLYYFIVINVEECIEKDLTAPKIIDRESILLKKNRFSINIY